MMHVLWITNRPIAAAERKYNVLATSGTWMKPTLDEMKFRKDITLSVATVASITAEEYFTEDGVDYYILPGGKKKIYDYQNKKNIAEWKRVIDKIRPSVIMVWGTEYAHGLCALKASGNIPSVIMVQGIIDTVEKNYLGGMTHREIRRAVTLRNIIKQDNLYQQQKFYQKKAEVERLMMEQSGNFVIENNWAKCHCEELCEGAKTFFCSQNVDKSFFKYEWKWDECEKQTIFCSAPGYPLKGLHNLIRALALVKRRYPHVKLYVPGMPDPYKDASLRIRFRRQGYTKYLMRLTDSLGLRENIVFLGRLDSEGMAKRMAQANVFAVPSSIENISTTLREAMAVGTPCIASYVGGIPEVVNSGENGFLYRFEEYEQLADYIVRLFSDRELAEKFSLTAKPKIQELVDVKKSVDRMIKIYRVLEANLEEGKSVG